MMTLILLESHVLLLYGFNSEQSTQIIQRMFFVKSCYRIDTNCRQTDQDDMFHVIVILVNCDLCTQRVFYHF